MKKTMAKITAALSAAVLCALPMASNLSANAAFPDYENFRGNVNYDSIITNQDATCIHQYVASGYGWNTMFTPEVREDINYYCDVNHDGAVNYNDATFINRVVALYPGNDSTAYTLRSMYVNYRIWGDANGDEFADMKDVQAIKTYLTTHSSTCDAMVFFRNANVIDSDNVINQNDLDYLMTYLIRGGQLGDADGDFKITTNDITALQKYINGTVTPNGIQKRNSDLNGDGQVTSYDLYLFNNSFKKELTYYSENNKTYFTERVKIDLKNLLGL